MTVLLNYQHVCADFRTESAIGLVVFVSYSMYFALLSSSLLSRPFQMILTSVATFGCVGLVIGIHFAISPLYGIGFGVFQGVLFPLLMWPISAVWSEESLVWLLGLVSVWTVLNTAVVWSYGIAVTLPIQLYRFPLLIQPISLLGMAFLDAFVVACNACFGVFLHKFFSRSPKSDCKIPLFRMVVMWVVWMSLSWYLWVSCDGSELARTTVATISPGYMPTGDLTDVLNLTRDASLKGAEFIVWPETFVRPVFPETCENFIAREISPLVSDFFLVVGCLEQLPNAASNCPSANLAVVVGPQHNGTILGSYGKQHPVSMIGEQSCRKNGYRVYSNGSISFSTLICYDMDFPDSAATVADLGEISLILNPSEDWSAARGHFAASVFRAVENRVAVAKADIGWDSAIIDGMGRIVEIYNSESVHRETLIATVPLYKSGKLHRLQQSLIPILAVLLTMFGLIICFKKLAAPRNSNLHIPLVVSSD